MTTAVPDAGTLVGTTETDSRAIADLARGEYRNVQENMPRDYVQMYHPDGTTSIIQLPPLGRNGKGLKDRQQKIMHFILNKRRVYRHPDGEVKSGQWWFPTPPAGWAAQPLPWRCPVEGCLRAGGLPDLLNLYRHIHQKHPGEKELYEGVIKAIKAKLAQAIPADLQTLLSEDGDTAPVASQADIDAANFTAAAEKALEGVPAEVFAEQLTCECGWQTGKGEQSLQLHKRMHCPLKEA